MRVELTLFPGGVRRALTMSYDDGREYDRRLVEIFNKNGIKGAFHLNSGNLGRPGYIEAAEVAELYRGHEVSVHTVTHPFLSDMSDIGILEEVRGDRAALEALCCYPVRGMSYPFGNVDERVAGICRAAGIEYSRTVGSTGGFGLPNDPLYLNPTCHHRGAVGKTAAELFERFTADQRYGRAMLFYLWGHSYEFNDADNWELIEEFCAKAGGRDDIWYATNIEVIDYMNAQKSLRYSADSHMIYNPSALDVWVSADREPVKIGAGKTITL